MTYSTNRLVGTMAKWWQTDCCYDRLNFLRTNCWNNLIKSFCKFMLEVIKSFFSHFSQSNLCLWCSEYLFFVRDNNFKLNQKPTLCLPMENYGRNIDDVGEFEMYLVLMESQLILFECSMPYQRVLKVQKVHLATWHSGQSIWLIEYL